ncbi:MAG TPA: Uma2 family endonuclease [Polyangiaceae bacterium]
MVAAPSFAPAPLLARAPDEQRMLLSNVGWKDYVILRDVLDGPAIRMTYLGGALELMSPSPEHELWKKNIARFVELYAHLRRIDLRGYGSTTFKSEAAQRGAEPDECYLIGKKLADVPDIVLEVIRTAPLLDKLAIYAALGVPEVWTFRDGAFSIQALDRASSRYAAVASSILMPELDFTVLAGFAMREDTAQALREFELIVRR